MREPIGPSLRLASDLLLQGRYSEALVAAKSVDPSCESALLTAKILLRLNAFEDVRHTLASVRATADVSDEQTALAAAYDAFAAAALGLHPQNDIDIATAYASWSTSAQPDIDYHIAGAYWMLNDRRADAIVSRYLSGEHPGLSPAVLGRFRLIRAWQFARAGQYVHQAATIIQTLRDLLGAQPYDAGLCAVAAQSLCALARDLHIPRAIAVLEDLLSTQPDWPADLAIARLQVERMLGWARAMHGDYIAAMRRFRAASRIADRADHRTSKTSPATHDLAALLVTLDQAWVAGLANQTLLLDASLADAAELLRRPWHSTGGDEAAAFVLAAELFAGHDLATAEHALDLARQARSRVTRNHGYADDPRLCALIDYADALVREARGDRRVAAQRAQRSYEVFSSVDYLWRASQSAIFLYRVTGASRWLEQAHAGAALYPRSFLAVQVEQYEAKGLAPEERLTARQREVLDLMKLGLNSDEIAERLACSSNTVRIHKGKIYRTFGVPQRSGLQGLLRALSRDAA